MASRNNLTSGLDRLLTDDLLSTSMLSFYNDSEKQMFRRDLFNCIHELDTGNHEQSYLKKRATVQCDAAGITSSATKTCSAGARTCAQTAQAMAAS